MECWLILGVAGFGKSSVVRALTGVGKTAPLPPPIGLKGALWKVDFATVTHDTFVSPLGLQEAWHSAADFDRGVRASGVTRAITCLRYHACNGLGDGRSYIAFLNAAGWNVRYAILGSLPTLGLPNEVRIACGALRHGSPSANGVAGTLRTRWGID
jgi:hypothetical protein